MSSFPWTTAATAAAAAGAAASASSGAFHHDPSSILQHHQVYNVEELEASSYSKGSAGPSHQPDATLLQSSLHAQAERISHSLPTFPPLRVPLSQLSSAIRSFNQEEPADGASTTTSKVAITIPVANMRYSNYQEMRISIKNWHKLAYPDGRGVSCPRETFKSGTDSRSKIYMACPTRANRRYECDYKINVMPEGRTGYVVMLVSSTMIISS
jgi:hypothetical protein